MEILILTETMLLQTVMDASEVTFNQILLLYIAKDVTTMYAKIVLLYQNVDQAITMRNLEKEKILLKKDSNLFPRA